MLPRYKVSVLHSSSATDSKMHVLTSLKLECTLQSGIIKLNLVVLVLFLNRTQKNGVLNNGWIFNFLK